MESSIREPFFLSPIDNTMPRTYAPPSLLLFPIPQSGIDTAVDTFHEGLRIILHAMPLLTGSLRSHSTPQMGAVAVTSPWRTVDEIWRLREMRGRTRYDYSELRRRGFPTTMFPMWDFSILEFYTDDDPPVMHVQVTLIDGGLVLALCVHHSFADGTGTNAILRIWASCCRGEVVDEGLQSQVLSRPSVLESNEIVPLEHFPEYTYEAKAGTRGFQSNVKSIEERKSWHMRYRLISAPAKKIQAFLKLLIIKPAAIVFTKYQSLRISSRLLWFSRAELKRLKESAMEVIDDDSDQKQPWFSTLDALAAMMFCCVTQARLTARTRGPLIEALQKKRTVKENLWTKMTDWLRHRLLPAPPHPPASQISAQLLTTVNVRKYCHPPVSPDYIGNFFLFRNVQAPILDLLPSIDNISSLALRLRRTLRDIDATYLRGAAAAIRSVPDVSRVGVSGGPCPELCLGFSSWREQDICRLEWGPGIGERCERVRTCEFYFDGLVIVFPEHECSPEAERNDAGGLEVFLSLNKGAMKELERDPFFNRFVEWR